ncbi:MAG: F-type H+-transporting ATPase subunit epsilon [Chloroflexota bacterium]|jgi:F-type H+-transporting ATPase subunit epsilon|nr:F-type H+-transporting ATPase subunit epsilon [Chloroflexota bacterium]
MPLHIEIVTAERQVLADEVDMVIAPATEGTIGILPHHAPLLTALYPGMMVLKKDGTEEVLAIGGGFLQVSHDRVLVLADAAERAEELDEARAQEARARAEAALRDAPRSNALEAAEARAALRRSLVRLNVAQRRRRRTGAQ